MYKARSLFVAMVVFLTITLFTPGCLTFELPGGCPKISASEAGVAATDSPTLIDQPTPMVDAGRVEAREDGGRMPMTTPDAGSSTYDHVLPTHPESGVVTALLAPTTCHGRRLGATTLAALGPFPLNHVLWHLCLKTPSRMTSTNALASERASRISIHLVDAGSTMNPIFSGVAPATANPWTLSVLIALPVGQPPTFHARAHYAGDQALSLAQTEPASVHGEWRSWRVASDGTQTEEAPRVICEEPLDTSNLTGVALPESACTLANQRCTVLPGYVCAAL